MPRINSGSRNAGVNAPKPAAPKGKAAKAPKAEASKAPAKPSLNIPKTGDPDVFVPSTGRTGAALKTVFTPGDAARNLEYASLDAVINARRADPKSYPAASNPYRIEYSVYNLTDEGVISRLAEAAKAGVYVQLLIDSDQISPDKPWNSVVADLEKAGFSHVESQVGLTAEQRLNTQIIEMEMPGIFHLKSRYFSYPDPATGKINETLLTGSHNPQTSAHSNDEVLHQLADPALIARYREGIQAMRDGKDVQNVWNEGAPLNVLFTSPTVKGPKAVDKIFEAINQEKELVLLSVFTLRNLEATDRSKLVDALVKARDRGCKVAVITDHKQADGVDAQGNRLPDNFDDQTDDLLQKAGIPTYEALNTSGPFNAMHLKAGLFGLSDMKVISDAGNWTNAVMGNSRYASKNAETILYVDSGKLDGNQTGKKYLGEFLRLLRKYGGQEQNKSAPDVEKLIAELQTMPSWPKVKVSFDVVAKTHMGQEVYITGSSPALSGWGRGIKLDTDASTYPNWRSAEVELPLGTRLEYKVVKRGSDESASWEPGENAILVVDPTLTDDSDHLRVSDAFNGD